MPSSSAVFRYLSKFHDEEEETKREPHRAFIPSATDALGGLRRVNSEMVGFRQRHARHTRATLDIDSTLVETHKQEVFYSYKKRKAYQPLSTYWAEADQIVHFVFENGVYEVTGGQKTPGAGTVDFAAMARAAGYRSAHTFDDAGEFERAAASIVGEEGPVLVDLRVKTTYERSKRAPDGYLGMPVLMARPSRIRLASPPPLSNLPRAAYLGQCLGTHSV